MLNVWVVIGFLGQCLFGTRFLIQWIESERAGRSVIPKSFWIFSILGSTLLMVYAVYRKDPVFILGQSAAMVIYSRNLYLIQRDRRTDFLKE